MEKITQRGASLFYTPHQMILGRWNQEGWRGFIYWKIVDK